MDSDSKDQQTYAIIGAAMEVHRELGHGFLEAVYHEALMREFDERGISFESEKILTIQYKGQPLNTAYRADFICFEEVVVEIKAIQSLTGNGESQLINYLKATGLKRGLLLNFGSFSLQTKRMVLNLC
jgi:GxxExxY protein